MGKTLVKIATVLVPFGLKLILDWFDAKRLDATITEKVAEAVANRTTTES